MNNTALLHIVERLEGFLGKLPDSIRRPVLNELTPLKELFLQQRPPRFVLTGSHPMPLLEFVARILREGASETPVARNPDRSLSVAKDLARRTRLDRIARCARGG